MFEMHLQNENGVGKFEAALLETTNSCVETQKQNGENHV